MTKLLVVAGSYQQMRNWMADVGYPKYQLIPPEVRYVRDWHDFRGYNNIGLLFIGTWYERKDAQELHDEAVWMIKSGRGYLVHGS